MVHALDDLFMKVASPQAQKFERFERETGQPPWLLPLRKAGLARFAELGFPTLQDEDWRLRFSYPGLI